MADILVLIAFIGLFCGALGLAGVAVNEFHPDDESGDHKELPRG